MRGTYSRTIVAWPYTLIASVAAAMATMIATFTSVDVGRPNRSARVNPVTAAAAQLRAR